MQPQRNPEATPAPKPTAAVKFTDKQILNLKGKPARYEVREGNAHGTGTLALRVSPNGHKAWQYLFRFDGTMRRMTLGTYPEMTVAQAHAACGAAMQAREAGRDPGAAVVASRSATRKAPTFKELADKFMEEHARPNKAAKSVANDDRTLKHDVLPRLGSHKAEAIERKDVRAMLAAIVARGAPVQANRTLALVRKIYNWGIGEDLVPSNPCIGVKAPGGKETQRDRVLTEAELQAVMAALPTATGMAKESRLALRFLVLTSQRCGEVLGLQWSEIDLAAGWWTIPAAKAKNRKSHRVPLSPQAKAVLTEARALNPDRQTVFPSPLGDRPMVETAVGRALFRNLEQFKAAPFTPHDLRRTAASHMTGIGIPRLVVSKILNHAEQGVTAIYDKHSYDKEKQDALLRWGRKVAALVAKAKLAAAA